jgi:hypothetical protein
MVMAGHKLTRVARWFIFAAALLGCERNGAKTPTTVPLTGVVSFDGAPVAGASVVFHPEGTDDRAASAVTDASGRFIAKTSLSGNLLVDGAVPGTYRVTVIKLDPRSSKSPAELMAAQTDGSAPAVVSVLPERYSRPETSGYTINVTEKGNRDLQLTLTR